MFQIYPDLFSWQQSGAKRAVYTIGNFDGVHRGHQRLLAELLALAGECDALAVAVSFREHTRGGLKPECAPTALTTRRARAALLQSLGIDALVELEFDEIEQLSGHDFLARLTAAAGEKACGFVVGEDFRFGAGRNAGAEDIARFLAGQGAGRLVSVPALCAGGERVSSSRIRALLLAGDAAGANILLGREYSLSGVRKTGDSIASRLGYPTVNLSEIGSLVPGDGVYASRLRYKGVLFPAMSYIGTRPTHRGAAGGGAQERRVETYTLNFPLRVLRGEAAEIFFISRLRDELHFTDEEALLRQLARDKEAALEAQ
jgi:riboflavin kinase/FMN adenylyltransferase